MYISGRSIAFLSTLLKGLLLPPSATSPLSLWSYASPLAGLALDEACFFDHFVSFTCFSSLLRSCFGLGSLVLALCRRVPSSANLLSISAAGIYLINLIPKLSKIHLVSLSANYCDFCISSFMVCSCSKKPSRTISENVLLWLLAWGSFVAIILWATGLIFILFCKFNLSLSFSCWSFFSSCFYYTILVSNLTFCTFVIDNFWAAICSRC